jgi:uncharacterized SAM-binding protein YcdF (DUF218 family)
MISPDILEAGDKDKPKTSTKQLVLPAGSCFWGIVIRKERWSFSWYGWLVVALVLLLGAVGFSHAIFPFLAVTHRVDSDVLVVEGWVHEYAIRTAISEFQSGHYHRVFTTGGPVAGMGGYTNDYNTSASVGAGRLKAAGLPPEFVQMVPSRINDRDRTYSAALALRNWFREHHAGVQSINVVTEDVHARRSRLLFQEAFGPGVKVGIISIPNPDYDSTHWWRYSEGVKEIISEGAAYIYASLFFYPADRHKKKRQWKLPSPVADDR